MLYCFLDTNIFIHWQDIKDIDWLAELGAEKVCLVIAPVVFEELDVFKDDPRNSRKRNRARRTINFLETVLDLPQKLVRNGVTLNYADDMHSIEFGIYGLNFKYNDDRLVASAICWSHKHSDDEISVVSHDSGPRMKAKRVGLTAKKLSEKYCLPDQLDSKDKEIRELKSKLYQIENAQPTLEIEILKSDAQVEGHLHSQVDFSEDYVSKDDTDRLVAAKRNELKKSVKTTHPNRIVGGLLSSFGTVTQADIEEYHKYVETWLTSEYAPYIRESSRFRVFQKRSVEVSLKIKNSGYGTAHGLDMHLTICGNLEVHWQTPEEVLYPEEPPLPSPGILPYRFHSLRMDDDLRHFPLLYSNSVDTRPTWTLETDDPRLKCLKTNVNILKPYEVLYFDPVYLLLNEFESDSLNLNIEYSILKENPGPKQTGNLCVLVNKVPP